VQPTCQFVEIFQCFRDTVDLHSQRNDIRNVGNLLQTDTADRKTCSHCDSVKSL